MTVCDAQGPSTIVFLGAPLADGSLPTGSDYFFPDHAPVKERMVTASADKPELIDELLSLIGEQDEAHAVLCQKAGLLVDEMLENALFAAPQQADGTPLFTKGKPRQLLPREEIRLRYWFNGYRLALEVRDNWGTLTASQVFHFLALNTATSTPDPDRAGRGLFFMWRLMDQFYVSIRPGIETMVGGCLYLHSHKP